MRVTFLGTSGAVPTTERNPAALMIAREGERLLFDCAEGTQRQMMRYGVGFGVDHVFLTHLHGDHVLGLPALLQTWGFNDRERALAVHTPAGTRSRVETLLAPTGDRPGYPVRVQQVRAGDVALDGDGYEVRAFDVTHRTNAVGYALVEEERKGRFDRERAEELGLEPGPKYSRLHEGNAVEHGGRTIDPSEVVGPPRPGRRVVYTGDTRPTDSTVQSASGADLLIHDSTFGEEFSDRARETAHSTAREAARVAREADVRHLALTHVSTRYTGRTDTLGRQAGDLFENAFVADDGLQVEIPYPDADRSLQTGYASR